MVGNCTNLFRLVGLYQRHLYLFILNTPTDLNNYFFTVQTFNLFEKNIMSVNLRMPKNSHLSRVFIDIYAVLFSVYIDRSEINNLFLYVLFKVTFFSLYARGGTHYHLQ